MAVKSISSIKKEHMIAMNAELNEFKREKQVEKKIKGVKFTVYGAKRIKFQCKTKDDFKQIYNTYRPTNKSHVTDSTSKAKYIATPFRLDLNNPANEAVFKQCLKISYYVQDVEIQCELPVDTLIEADYVRRSFRAPTDSEHVHFIGTEHKDLHKISIPCNVWTRGETLNWYGGNQTLLNVVIINEIIFKHILNDETYSVPEDRAV